MTEAPVPPPPLTTEQRSALLTKPRPRSALPIFQPRSVPAALADRARAVDRADRPVYVVWELTLKCDLACRHCGSRAGVARPAELSLAEALDLVGQLQAIGVKEVTLIGGEAYLYEGWLQVVAAIRRLGMQCSVVTAGRGWTRDLTQSAKQAGVQTVSFSLDGDETSHDRLRGARGAYRSALEGMNHSTAVGLPISVNTQVNRLSLPHLSDVFEQVMRSGAHGWQIQLTVPAGRAADEPELILQPHDLLVLFPLLAELKQRALASGIKCLLGNNVGYFGPYDHVLRNMSACGHSGTCKAGRLALGIEANGDIKGCPSLPSTTFVGGNIREHTLKDIWERSSALRFNRDRGVKDLWGYCKGCYYADECRGGCTWMSSSLFGRAGNNPYCHHRALEFQREGKRERVRLKSEAPGTPFDHGVWEILEEAIPAQS